jgi:RNA polymerase sigma-70 factor (ECF subfamily)
MIMSWPAEIHYTYKINFGVFLRPGISMNLDDLIDEQAGIIDPQALGSLHDQLYPAVFRYVSFRLQDQQLCEDITSEVFVRLLDACHRQNRKIKDVRAWVFGTASNLINDYFRQKYRRKFEDLEDHQDLAAEHSTEGSVDRTLTIREISWAIGKLTPNQQNVIALRFSQELSLEETAAIVGKSVNAVKVLQFRALAAMRRILEEKWNHGDGQFRS